MLLRAMLAGIIIAGGFVINLPVKAEESAPEGPRFIERCVKIEIPGELSNDIAVIAYISGPQTRAAPGVLVKESDGDKAYVVEPGACLQSGHPDNSLALYAISRQYLQDRGIENIRFGRDYHPQPLDPSVEIDLRGRMPLEGEAFEKEELYYSVLGFKGDNFVAYLSRRISGYPEGTPDTVEEYPRPEIAGIRMTVNR